MIQPKENHKQEINLIVGEVCSNIPKAFWHKKQHEVELPYKPNFSEKNIPTKARPIKMNKELLSYCDKEIQDLLDKKLIRKSNPLQVVQPSMFRNKLN